MADLKVNLIANDRISSVFDKVSKKTESLREQLHRLTAENEKAFDKAVKSANQFERLFESYKSKTSFDTAAQKSFAEQFGKNANPINTKDLVSPYFNDKTFTNSLSGASLQSSSTGGSKSSSWFSSLSSFAGKLAEFAQPISDIAWRFQLLNNHAEKTPSLFSRMSSTAGKALAVFGGYKVVNGIFNTITGSIGKAINRLDTFDVFQRKMELITGDANQATFALNEMKDATKGTAYMLDTAAQTVQNFVTRGMKTEDATKSVRIWMDAVSAYGNGTNEQFESVADAIAKMRTKGTVEMRYLNRLFAVGINPVKMYAQAVGMAETDVQEALSGKDIRAEEFLNTVEKAMREGTNGVIKVEGMAKNVATTWAATIANMGAATARGVATLIEGLDAFLRPLSGGAGIKGFIKSYGVIFEDLTGKVGGALRIVGDTINQEMIYFQRNNSNLYEGMGIDLDDYAARSKEIWARISETVSLSTRESRTLFQSEYYKMADAQRWFKEHSAQLWTTISEQIEKILPTLGRVSIKLGTTLGEGVYKILDAFVKLANLAVPAIFTRFENFLTKLEDKVPWVSSFFDDITESINNFAESLPEKIQNSEFLDKIENFALITLPPLIEKIKEIAGLIVEFVAGPGKDFVKVWMDLSLIKWQLKLDVLQMFLQFVVDHPKISVTLFSIYEVLKMFGGLKLGGTLLTHLPGILSFLEKLGENGVFAAIAAKLGGLSGAFSSLGASLSGLGGGLLGGITAGLSGLWAVIVAHPVGAILAVVGALGILYATYEPFRDWVNNMGVKLKEFWDYWSYDNPEGVIKDIPKFQDQWTKGWDTFINESCPQVLDRLNQALGDFGDKAVEQVETIGRDWNAGWSGLWNYVTSFDWGKAVDSWTLGLTQGFERFGTSCQEAWGKVEDFWNNTIVPGFETIKNGLFNWDFNKITTDTYNNMVNSGDSAISGYYDGAMRTWGSKEQDLLDKFSGLHNQVDDINDSHSPSKVFIEKGAYVVEGYKNGITETFETLKPVMLAPFSDLANSVQGIQFSLGDTTPFTNSATQLAIDFVNAFNIQWEESIPSIQEKFALLKQSFNGEDSTLSQSASQMVIGFVDEFNASWEQNIPVLQTLFTDFGSSISTYIGTGFADNFSTLQEGIHENLLGLISSEQTDSVVSQFRQLGTDSVTALIEAFEQTLPDALETIQTNFSTMKGSIQTDIETLNVDISSIFNEIATDTESVWSEVEESITKHISSMRTDASKELGNFDKDFRSILDPLPGYTNQLGMDMMSQMSKGIEDAKATVTTSASGLVQQLKNVFEGGLGIHSPSDYMIWVGKMMLAGLIEGMSPTQIQKFIDSVIGDMQTSFANGRFNANELVNFISDDATMNLIGRLSDVDMSNLASLAPETIAYPLIGTRGTQTSWFGHRPSPGGIGSTNHGGVDIAAPTGTPIAAALAGNVTTAGWYGGYGNAVVVDSGNGIDITYGHMSRVLTQVGQSVSKGQQIGLVGSTGNSTGPHLHFEMHQNGSRIDPQPYIDGGTITGGITVNPLVAAIQAALAAKNGVFAMGSTAGSGLIEPDWFKSWQPSQAVARWAPIVMQALSILGEPASLLKGVLWAINGESGGNPNAINLTDYNASIGDPTKGLLQIMMANFKPVSQGGWGVPGYTNNIWDPLENILTGLGEMKWKPIYANSGGIAGVINRRLAQRGWSGYAVGTRYVPQDMLTMIHEGEAIIPKSQNPYVNSGGDYLRDLVSSMIPTLGFDTEGLTNYENTNLNIDLGALTGSGTTNNQNNDNRNLTLNNNYNIATEEQAKLNAREVELMIHGFLSQGSSVGRRG